MALFLLGLIPFRLPRWMYPDWQADKCWWRAERARLERKAEQARQAERGLLQYSEGHFMGHLSFVVKNVLLFGCDGKSRHERKT